MKQKKMNGKTLLCVLLVLAQLLLLTIPAVADGTTTPTEVVGLNETASLMRDDFRFFLPDADDKNIIADSVSNANLAATNVMNFKLDTDEDAATVRGLNTYTSGQTMQPYAYIAYKLTNNGTTAALVGTQLQIGRSTDGVTTSVNRNAGATLPLCYDVVTGERLDSLKDYNGVVTSNAELQEYCTTYDYAKSQGSTLFSSNTVGCVSIPAGATVYMVVPFTSVNEDRGIKTFAVDDTSFSAGTPAQGNLRGDDATKAGSLSVSAQTYYLYAVNVYVKGTSYDVEAKTWDTDDTYSLSVSECYAMSMEEYTSRYNEFDFNILEGASVRLGTPTGLRFEATVDSNDWDYLINRYGAENVTMGTIITPSTNATTDAEMTFAYLNTNATTTTKYLNVTAGDFYKKVGDDFVIAGSIANISENNYTKNYVGRAYIKVVDGDSTFYLYATGAQSRNISYIASQALLDTKPAEDKENGYIYQLDENKWSCYDPETEIPILEGFVVSQGQ